MRLPWGWAGDRQRVQADVKAGLYWLQGALNLPLKPGSRVLVVSSGDGTWASGGVSAQAPGVRFQPLASRSSDGEHGFLNLGHREMADCLQVDMRKVGYLVSRHNGIDNCRAVDLERLADRSL